MPEWYDIAQSYVGLKEIPGAEHNPTILSWLKRHALNIGKWGQGRDETPWCAVFVSHCLSAAGMQPTNDARAKSYVDWGFPCAPRPGAIAVLQRKQGKNTTGSNRGGYHVFFLDKISKEYYWGYGGNQKNAVRRSAYPKRNYELVALRWPTPDYYV